MSFIKVLPVKGRTIYVNIDKISYIHEISNRDSQNSNFDTYLIVFENGSTIETYEDIGEYLDFKVSKGETL